MTENEALEVMLAPGDVRPGKYGGGVIQVMVTRACDKACCCCTQNSQLAGKSAVMTTAEFKAAVESLDGYWGIVGVFGGNPATHTQFVELCAILRDSWVPWEKRGVWCNNPISVEKARAMRATFNPRISNLNVHMDAAAHATFLAGWPESEPELKGLYVDSRHSPTLTGMSDLGVPEAERWDFIASCDVNRSWSALVGVVPGFGLRAYFCEVAYAFAALHGDGDDGLPAEPGWWRKPMRDFTEQVRKRCHNCGVPLRRFGELAVRGDREEASASHIELCVPKRRGRAVELVTVASGERLEKFTRYYDNASR